MKKYVSATALRAALYAALLVCGVSNAALAQAVPSPWTTQDIGSPTLSGFTTYSSGVFSADGAGVDIWGTSDQFHFVYQPVAGDVEVIARVGALDAVYSWTNAGVMIRSSLAGNSAHVYTASTSANGVYFRRRLTAGATTTSVAGPKIAAPVWVRLVRQGTLVTSYSSTNGTTWTTIGSSSITLSATAYVGLAVTSHNTAVRATATMSNVKVTKLGGGVPSGFQNQDIGGPAVAGSVTQSSGTYTIKAAGRDIWDVADQFHFLYKSVTGNVDVKARIASITNQNSWSKAGVMIRESLAPESRHAMSVLSYSNGYRFQRRPDPAAYSVSTSGGTGQAPGWVRLVRTGDLFESYRSADGATWTKMASDTIPMGQTVYVGIAATSHNEAAATTVVADNLTVTSSATGNQPPAVSITAPATGTQVTLPATVTISATATDPENRMASVDFYAGSTLIFHDTTAPYGTTWAPSAAGTYPLTAVAHDADGGSTTSSAVNVTVNSATNQAPTVSLTSPAAGASFTAPATITLSASASDPENQLARVEFFSGATKVATDTTAPYSFSWTNVAAGTYSITAKAYDAAGASASTAARTITVTAPLTPPKTVVFTKSTDHATGVTNYVFKVFAAGANPATATPVATSDLGKPTPATNGDITVDRTAFFNALAVGSYLATVTAIGPGGQTQGASVTFTR